VCAYSFSISFFVCLSVSACVRVCLCASVWVFFTFFVIIFLAVGDTKGGACLGLCFLPSDNPF
jgi:hypothetical protein